MTTVTVTTTSATTPATTARMVMRSIDNKYVLNFPIAPREVEYGGWGWTWTEIPRDGRTPYLVREAFQLHTMSFTAKIVYSKYVDKTVDAELIKIKDMATGTVPLTIKYGGWMDARIWRIEEFTINSVQRHPTTNAVIWAEVDISLKEASDIKLSVGPISGGKTTASKTSTTSKSVSSSKTAAKKSTKTRYYKVKKGDTLLKLANKLYGDPQRWRYLADKNKIKNPKNTKKLKTGTKIKY